MIVYMHTSFTPRCTVNFQLSSNPRHVRQAESVLAQTKPGSNLDEIIAFLWGLIENLLADWTLPICFESRVNHYLVDNDSVSKREPHGVIAPQ